MKVKEIMIADAIQCCSTNTKLHHAVQIMKDGNCGALPVLDEQKKVIGMVTDRDIALSLADKKTNLTDTTVEEIIPRRVYSTEAEADLKDALKEMRTHKIGRLPVLDKNGKLKGVLSLHNLLMQAFNGKTELGSATDKGESILKTVKALHERYNGPLAKTKVEASKKALLLK